MMILPDLQLAKKRTKEKVKTIDYKIEDKYQKIGQGKNYFIKTYGCQMNEHDSENIKAILEQMSFKESDFEKADLIIINTCAIRENAHNKVFGMLGKLKHLKEEKPNLLIGVCGCMTQEPCVAEKIQKEYKWIDIVFGTHNIYNLPEILSKSLEKQKQNIEIFSIQGDIIENIPAKRDSKYKAWVNIMYGCDKFCTYCIVPYTRGKQRSRNPENIIKEIKELKEKGYKEITLLGQNVNAYGKDLDINYNMNNLLEDVAKTNIERVRFITSHPWDFTDEMIETIAKYNNIMPYIHLPLQSGSDKILKQMGRKYTKDSYIKLFKKIKKTIPNCAITTDIIVGFPNETEDDFKQTLEVVNICKFDSAFTFVFSPRIGTPASKMKDNITNEEKFKRLYKLNELINKYSKESNEKYINKTVKVLLENKGKTEGYLMGYTPTMKLVNVRADDNNIGKIINVKITEAKTWSLDGKIDKS